MVVAAKGAYPGKPRPEVVVQPRERLGDEIGRCTEDEIEAVDRALRGWLSLDGAIGYRSHHEY